MPTQAELLATLNDAIIARRAAAADVTAATNAQSQARLDLDAANGALSDSQTTYSAALSNYEASL